MFSTQLKIKRLSLAAEARIIRREEQRCLGWQPNPDAEILRQKRRIRKAGFKPKLDVYESLHNHRTDKVRKASRIAHLCHAYLMARPYVQVENERTKSIPDALAISEDIITFGPLQFASMEKRKLRLSVEAWIDGGATIPIEETGGAAAEEGTLKPDLAGSTPVAASNQEVAQS